MKRERLAIAVFVTAILLSVLIVAHSSEKSPPTFYLCGAAKKAWEPIIKAFENKYHVKVRVIYGSSGALLNQLEMSKIGDIYSAAMQDFMNKAVKDGVVDPRSVRAVACLQPALLYRKGVKVNITAILNGESHLRIAMCNPEGCAVGRYFKNLLERNGDWDKVKREIYTYAENFPKLVALLYLGEVDAVFGWHVAKYWYPNKIDYVPFNTSNLPCIVIGIPKYAKHKKVAQEFIDFVISNPYSKYIFFTKYHYVRPGDSR